MLYEFTLQVIEEKNLRLVAHTDDLDNSPLLDDVLSIRTYYEMLFRGKGMPIHYVKFGL
jgi:tRNA (guanine-N7-)-methyltransferase